MIVSSFITRHRAALSTVLLTVTLVLASVTHTAASDPHARIVDGRTIMQNGETFHLRHISVPALGATCQRIGKSLDCGRIARAQLIDISIGATIDCTRTSTGDHCRADGFDLSYGMVHAGWARAQHISLTPIEAKARQQQRGLWHSDYTPPGSWQD